MVNIDKYEIPWTSDASGAASATTPHMNGLVFAVKHVPGSGSSQPTDGYDVTVSDSDGITVATSTSCSNSSAEWVPVQLVSQSDYKYSNPPVDGVLTVTIANAGSAKSGKVVIYILRE